MWAKFDALVDKYGPWKASVGVFVGFVVLVAVLYGLASLY